MVRRRERLLPPAAPVDGEAARRERLGARGEALLVEVGGGGPLLHGRAAARRRPLLTATLRQLALGGGDLLRHKPKSMQRESLFYLGFLAILFRPMLVFQLRRAGAATARSRACAAHRRHRCASAASEFTALEYKMWQAGADSYASGFGPLTAQVCGGASKSRTRSVHPLRTRLLVRVIQLSVCGA